ncbi:MAG: hypothetical protein GX649_00745 [Chloroflexi bacterium]|nr:hypothetical protein [Chloroflexota bacterium]
MTRIGALTLALLLMLVSLVLVSLGTTNETTWLWWLGLAALLVGALIPPVIRYALPEEENGD